MWCCLGPAVLRAAWTAPGGDQWTVQCQGISQSLVEAKHALLFPELLPLVPNCISLKNISHSDMCLLPFIPALDSTGITLVPFCGFNFTPSHTCSFISVSFTQEFSKTHLPLWILLSSPDWVRLVDIPQVWGFGWLSSLFLSWHGLVQSSWLAWRNHRRLYIRFSYTSLFHLGSGTMISCHVLLNWLVISSRGGHWTLSARLSNLHDRQ